ncbi:MAG: 6-phosphogluconolactonase [Anaerolineae bacterium CG03_land_8_20_14_0_80_58_20]|nr:MAG: 6-phosphogluconolactonase [Anaerolineae bacterium CG03_land_8_20_14_0_80_58_20]
MAGMKPTIRIFKDADELSRAAADLFVTLAVQSIRERGRFLVALSGGSTPMALYRLLAREPIDWTRIHVFWGDERLVPPEDAENSYGQAREALLKHIPIPTENIHRVASELDPVAAARDYASILREFAAPPLDWPRFDLVLLGLGEDGHTASLFPGSPVDATEPVIAVTAQYQGRPARRVTLTPLVFNAARQVIFLVTGANKAVTLRGVFDDYNSSEQIPAKRIQPADGQVTWLVDKAAGKEIKPSD